MNGEEQGLWPAAPTGATRFWFLYVCSLAAGVTRTLRRGVKLQAARDLWSFFWYFCLAERDRMASAGIIQPALCVSVGAVWVSVEMIL